MFWWTTENLEKDYLSCHLLQCDITHRINDLLKVNDKNLWTSMNTVLVLLLLTYRYFSVGFSFQQTNSMSKSSQDIMKRNHVGEYLCNVNNKDRAMSRLFCSVFLGEFEQGFAHWLGCTKIGRAYNHIEQSSFTRYWNLCVNLSAE